MNFPTTKRLFEIHEISQSYCGNSVTRSKPTCGAVFEVVWIEKGIGTALIDMERIEFKENTLWFVRSGHFKGIQCDAGMTGYRIIFSRTFLSLPTEKSAIPMLFNHSENALSWHAVRLDHNGRNELECMVSLMIQECQSDEPMKFDILQGCLKIVVGNFSRLAKESSQISAFGNDLVLFNTFITMVEEQFHLRKLVCDYADELAVSPNYLSEVARRVSGYSAGHHIRQRILLEAKRMVLNTTMQAKQIAYELGFEDASTFSKFFKKHAGRNLTELRYRGALSADQV